MAVVRQFSQLCASLLLQRLHHYIVHVFYKNIKTLGNLQMFLIFSVISLKMFLTCSYFQNAKILSYCKSLRNSNCTSLFFCWRQKPCKWLGLNLDISWKFLTKALKWKQRSFNIIIIIINQFISRSIIFYNGSSPRNANVKLYVYNVSIKW